MTQPIPSEAPPGGTEPSGEARARAAVERVGIPFTTVRHGPVRSLAEAAAARGIRPQDLVKTLVVRRGDNDFLLVLVPGDRQISWPRLREHLGVSRLSMPDADTALEATGFERGTITPFGSRVAWPVVADAAIVGRAISIGGGAHGVGLNLQADDLIRVLHADVAGISEG